MSRKTPAVSTQLKTAQAQIADLEKKLKDATDAKDRHYRSWQDQATEVDQLHAFFDALPGSIPRQDEKSYKMNSAMTRLAAWLATK